MDHTLSWPQGISQLDGPIHGIRLCMSVKSLQVVIVICHHSKGRSHSRGARKWMIRRVGSTQRENIPWIGKPVDTPQHSSVSQVEIGNRINCPAAFLCCIQIPTWDEFEPIMLHRSRVSLLETKLHQGCPMGSHHGGCYWTRGLKKPDKV